jgi:hypothetical protein
VVSTVYGGASDPRTSVGIATCRSRKGIVFTRTKRLRNSSRLYGISFILYMRYLHNIRFCNKVGAFDQSVACGGSFGCFCIVFT